jgi:hypothetical protein
VTLAAGGMPPVTFELLVHASAAAWGIGAKYAGV